MSTERTPLWIKLQEARGSTIKALALLVLAELSELDPDERANVLREAVRLDRRYRTTGDEA